MEKVMTYEQKKERIGTADKLFVLLSVLLSVSFVLKYYVSPSVYGGFVYALHTLVIVLGLFFARGRFRLRNRYELFYLLVFFVCLLNTVLRIDSSTAQAGKIECIFIYSAILCALIYKNTEMKVLKRLFVVMGVVSVVLLLFALSRTSINISFAIRRGYQWSEIFYYAAVFCLAPALLIYSVVKNEKIWFAVLVYAADIVLSLIIVKRIILLQTASLILVAVLISLFKRDTVKTNRKLLLAIAVAVVAAVLFYGDTLSQLLESVFNRTMEVAESSEDIAEFNRFFESKQYFSGAGLPDILIGRGFNGSHTSLGVLASALHVGWSNFILKGGVPLLILVVIPYFKCFRTLPKFKTFSEKKQFCTMYLLYMLPMLFISNLHGHEPTMFLFFFCCLEVMNTAPDDYAQNEVKK